MKKRNSTVVVTDWHRFDLTKDTAVTLNFHGNETQLTTKYGNVFERAKILKIKLWCPGTNYDEKSFALFLLDVRGNQGAPSGSSMNDWLINTDWPDPGQKKVMSLNKGGFPSVTFVPKGNAWFDIWESGYNLENAVRVHGLWTTEHSGWTSNTFFYEVTWLLEA